MGLNLSGPAALWGFKLLSRFFYALGGNMNIRHFEWGLGLRGEMGPESCKSCRVLCAIRLRLIKLSV